MNHKISISTILILIALIASKAGAIQESDPKKTQDLTAEQTQLNLESFDYVWKTVHEKYFDPKLGGVDWVAARTEFRPKIQAAKTQNEVTRLIGEMLDRMKVSHFAVIPKRAYQKLGQDKPIGRHTTGIDLRIVDGKVLVVQVDGDSPAAKQGVKPGWQLLKVGNDDIAGKLKSLDKELADHLHRRTILVAAANSKLRANEGENIEAVFLDGNDAKKRLTLSVAEPRGKKMRFGNIPEFHVWIDVKTLANNIGYIRFNAFMYPPLVSGKFNQAMKKFMDADGIIIDVRGNGGGSGEMGSGMIGWIMKTEKAEIGKAVFRTTELKMLARARPKTFPGPVVLLIDESSVSAAEFFASGIKDLDCGYLIGTRTAGAVLGSSVERLPNGDGFQYAHANFISAKTGKTLEGIGVTPDLEVKHSRQALLQNRDLQLEAAIKWINNQNSKNP